MTAAAAAVQIVRHRRALVAGGVGAMGVGWTVVMAVVVVAMGGTPGPAELAAGLGVPVTAMDAYQRAAVSPDGAACGMRWQILAGIGRVESNHAGGRRIEADGSVAPPIIGPVLDGTGFRARVVDTDRGALDGDSRYDRAVGPLQFLPSSWQLFGDDGSGDGTADPNNFYDAAVAATRHLCAGGGRVLTTAVALANAARAYNHSDAYVSDVLHWINYYDRAAAAGPSEVATPSGNIVNVRGILVDASIAGAVDALVNAASEDGLAIAGGGYRTRDEQIALRRAHCGGGDYAIFEMPADGCSPPTARPGESLHESGLAIDFTCNGVLVRRGDPCFQFLSAEAASYGLFNLASEPWHWSVDGR